MGVAGYLRATGIHEKKLVSEGGIQEGAAVDSKTVDLGAIAAEGVREVKESLTKSSK
jgi:rhomboid-like protein